MLIHDKKVYIVYKLNGLKTFDLWVNNVGFWTQKNRQIVVFFENGGGHKNDNHILVGNKLIVT